MFGVNSDLGHGRGHNNPEGVKDAARLNANDLIVKLSGETTNEDIASDLYLLVCLENPNNITVSNPEEKAALRKAIERYFVGPDAKLSVTTSGENSHSLTCGSRQILNFARFLDSPALALHVATRAHHGLGDALLMLFESKRETPESFRQIVETLFPKFGLLSTEELSQRLRLIEALGDITFTPRPVECNDPIFSPTMPENTITDSERTDLSEGLLSFLDRAKLFMGQSSQNSQAHNMALVNLSRAIAVGALITEPHQIRRAISTFPELVNTTAGYISNYSQRFRGSEMSHAAGLSAINWGDALLRALSSDTKLGSLNIGRCLVNFALGQIDGECDASLILRLCKPGSNQFSRFSSEIAAELYAQLKEPRSPLKDALSPGTLPFHINQRNQSKPYADQAAYNVKKLELFDCLLKHESREIRDLAAAEMRHIGHQFPSFLHGESSALYYWTQIRASRPYRFFSGIF